MRADSCRAEAHRTRPRSHRSRSRPGGASRTGSSPSGACSPTSRSPTCCSTCQRADGRWIVVGQVRPATGQTMYPDRLGRLARQRSPRPRPATGVRRSSAVEGDIDVEGITDETRMLAIPVLYDGAPIAVLDQGVDRDVTVVAPASSNGRTTQVFDHFVTMIAAGDVPVPAAGRRLERGATRRRRRHVARCGRTRCSYVSPNASSALHRVGIQASAVGHAPRRARVPRRSGAPGVRAPGAGDRGVRAGPDVTLLCRCVPFLDGDHVTGGGACCCATSPSSASATGCC